jgi:hypothetical protein
VLMLGFVGLPGIFQVGVGSAAGAWGAWSALGALCPRQKRYVDRTLCCPCARRGRSPGCRGVVVADLQLDVVRDGEAVNARC